ncbi:hypothetical protein CTRI78_v009938 [Colletotrichum trifolii]|uniref:EGF-like domain-containing protein n=1 Tax=Colletotrichum trifolii TaxID=5466 RepID=A0A4R8QPB9_COLTR|nr:hypothetical protein CTRI78_v009938 [Colletotrichum trifolii]
MQYQSLFVLVAVLLGQAAAQASPATTCLAQPPCDKTNLGVACKVTCHDNPGGTRVTQGYCKQGFFGPNCQ